MGTKDQPSFIVFQRDYYYVGECFTQNAVLIFIVCCQFVLAVLHVVG